MSELHIDVLPVIGDVGAVADGVADLPADLLRRWRLAGGVQVRTLLTARSGRTLVGSAFEVHRPLTAYRKIVDVWTRDDHDGQVADALVTAVEERAWREGAVAVKRWFPERETEPGSEAASGSGRASGSAWERSLARGYRELTTPTWAGPVTARPEDTGHGQVRWRDGGPRRAVPYMRQTTDFTCGPVALQMGLCGLGLQDRPGREQEMRLWREATTVGGCEPLGLALAAADRGAVPEVVLSTEEPILLELCRTDEERDLRAFIQAGFRAETAARGIDVETAAFDLDRLRGALDDGGVALVLIEQFGMHAESCPHWITVHGVSGDGDVFYVNDPWTDADLGETWVDALDLPLPAATLDRLAWYGTPSYRGMIVLRGGR